MDTELTPETPEIRGLVKLFQTATEFDVERIAFPLFLVDTEEMEMVSPEAENITQRAKVVLQTLWEMLKEAGQDFRGFQVVLPSLASDVLTKRIRSLVTSQFTVLT